MGLKIAVAGKGGSGKTTVSVLLAGILTRRGHTVLLVDLDSDPNLAQALGRTAAPPLARREELVLERTGASGGPGSFFVLNPRVSDLAERCALPAGDRLFLLTVGAIDRAGEGCYCPQAAFVRSLVKSLVLSRRESVVLDLEAGLEPFGRAAVEGIDLLLVVVEPGLRSISTAGRIAAMAPDLGIRNVKVVANKVRPGEEEALLRRARDAGFAVDAVLPHRDELARRDLRGESILDFEDPDFARDIEGAVAPLG